MIKDGIKDEQKQSWQICIHIKICFEIFFFKGTEIETCMCIGTDAEYLLILCSYPYNHCYLLLLTKQCLANSITSYYVDQNYIKHMQV